MTDWTRRAFLELALALGASSAWASSAKVSRIRWREQRESFPEGVASGDPDASSVLLWTRSPATEGAKLTVEVAEDPKFERVVATSRATLTAATDWTCRVLVGGLKPATVYWYRFAYPDGRGSRVGRTITAPAENDARPVRFAFVSCQNINDGYLNSWRRMIYEDERVPEPERLDFVLHLGDFIYEVVWYPEDRARRYDRAVREAVRYKNGEKIRDFHVPTTLDDYRAVYKAYLHDPDLQDARARWPFVCMWDNHEFSWLGYQTIQKFFDMTRPAQKVKVMANQAFWEFRPTRAIDRFVAPRVENVPVAHFDDHGLGQEPNNLAAIRSLKGHRALRFGRNVELIITDQHSYRSEDPTGRTEAKTLANDDVFPDLVPEEALQILDAGRTYGGGNPPKTIQGAAGAIENFRASAPPQTILGAEQKAWFLDRLRRSKATWKIWGSTGATLDMRADPQNLPAGMTRPWWGSGYAGFGGGDPSSAYVERAEIYDFVRDHAITGFATVAGDRHSFWAGLASKSLPPAPFVPVGVAFVTGSISAPGILEALEHSLPKDHPLRALYVPALNMLLRHGVRSCLEYAKSGDIAAARAQSNSELSPHLSFVDMGGHGYAVVTARSDAFDVEFVCIPRPAERSEREDGGPLAYRVRFHTPMWEAGKKPELAMRVVEGDPKFSI